MKYKAVIFDLFGTLVPQYTSSAFETSIKQMAQAVGIAYPIFYHSWTQDTRRERDTGEFDTIEANVEYICRINGLTPTQNQLSEAAQIRYLFAKTILQVHDNVIPTLRIIKGKGLSLGLVSNCSAEVPDIWCETPFSILIDAPIFSCEVGVSKPDWQIYDKACKKLNLSPDMCIYVGDGFSQELQGAASFGLFPILIEPQSNDFIKTTEWEGETWTGERIKNIDEIVGFI